MSAQDGRHGCEIRADYLGARMLSTLSTGLGALQKSLAELYFRFRQTNNHVNAVCQQRLLRVTSDGLYVTSQPTGEHDELHPTSCLLYWDAVQFVTVKSGSGVQCAFEPIDNDISRNTVCFIPNVQLELVIAYHKIVQTFAEHILNLIGILGCLFVCELL